MAFFFSFHLSHLLFPFYLIAAIYTITLYIHGQHTRLYLLYGGSRYWASAAGWVTCYIIRPRSSRLSLSLSPFILLSFLLFFKLPRLLLVLLLTLLLAGCYRSCREPFNRAWIIKNGISPLAAAAAATSIITHFYSSVSFSFSVLLNTQTVARS